MPVTDVLDSDEIGAVSTGDNCCQVRGPFPKRVKAVDFEKIGDGLFVMKPKQLRAGDKIDVQY